MDEKNKLTKEDIDIILLFFKSICALAWIIGFIVVYVEADILGAMIIYLITYFLGMKSWMKKDFGQIRYIPEGIMCLVMIVIWFVLTIHTLFITILFTIMWIWLWFFIVWLSEPITWKTTITRKK